ncbi:DUF2357 domain-containing protein [Paenibacillus sp. Soil724D2]|uniref:DUF2357 domain-containing protein n=1 Tax=Paenibacillus sp. (strain Soil724D2) TaxID=1736392 RepID=UPI0007163D69|nr:DUF2357 domain-containing protein [Paenibacillus sp. Soil724D2]KRE50647.1 hypothetical protein ASG85_20560 [Paenibacillus sp. Soil724D2]
MEPLSFGDSFLVRSRGSEWISIEKAYLTEATEYEWLWEHIDFSILLMQGVPLTYRKVDSGVTGQFMTPFQSGQLTFTVEKHAYLTYVYPDDRKMTAEQYDIMLHEILDEAAVCFDHAGLTIPISAQDRARDISWAQWSYIDHGFKDLASYIRRFLEHPLKRLSEKDTFLKREQMKVVTNRTSQWLERHYAQDPSSVIPANVLTHVRMDTYNIYENRVIKRYLLELQSLLVTYMHCSLIDVSKKAAKYGDLVRYWLRQGIFQEITSYQGPIQVSTIFRKHPVYRLCYRWFDHLYQHGNERIGFEYPFPLKDTFALYEIWCYMQVLRLLREKGLIKNSANLYKSTLDRFFLSLAKHKESHVSLVNGHHLYYQRVFQYNSDRFYSFTQRMEPDITLESHEGILVFDPKYRVPTNLSTALGEMHKYRDGILIRDKETPAVDNVFILTPSKGQEELRYFQEWYHKQYRMGAIEMVPGGPSNPALERAIDGFMKNI